MYASRVSSSSSTVVHLIKLIWCSCIDQVFHNVEVTTSTCIVKDTTCTFLLAFLTYFMNDDWWSATGELNRTQLEMQYSQRQASYIVQASLQANYNVSASYSLQLGNSLQLLQHSQQQLYHAQHKNCHNWFDSWGHHRCSGCSGCCRCSRCDIPAGNKHPLNVPVIT